MNKSFLALIAFLFLVNIVSAQIVRNMYHISDIGDINNIHFDFPTDYKLIPHASSNILIHTKVSIGNCNENIIITYADSLKRYDIVEEFSKTELRLIAVDKVRKRFSTKNLACHEEIDMSIYIPDDFNIVDKTLISRLSQQLSTEKQEEEN